MTPNEQPRYFTLFDLIVELIHVGFIAAGGFAGWKAGGHFLAMFLGCAVGRVVVVLLFTAIRARCAREGEGGS